MRFIGLLVGGVVIMFLLPTFMDIWAALKNYIYGVGGDFTGAATKPLIDVYYVIVPYVWIIVFVIAAFLIVSMRRRE